MTTRTQRGIEWMVALSCAVALSACGEERVRPVSSGASTSAGGTGGAGEGGGAGTGGGGSEPAVRSVFARNPIGVPFDNLLADGDFELSIVPAQAAGGQYGWRAFSPNGGQAALLAETGGLCRSGLRCGRLGEGRVLFGQGTAASGERPHRASLWVKAVDPTTVDAEKPCELIERAFVVRCESFATVGSLKPSDAPDERGWCEYAGTSPSSRDALCLYVELDAREVLLDAATLLPREEPDALPAPLPPTPDAPTRARMETIRAAIRSRMPLSSESLPFDTEGRPRDPRLRRGLER
jgi:hypothetical protein